MPSTLIVSNSGGAGHKAAAGSVIETKIRGGDTAENILTIDLSEAGPMQVHGIDFGKRGIEQYNKAKKDNNVLMNQLLTKAQPAADKVFALKTHEHIYHLLEMAEMDKSESNIEEVHSTQPLCNNDILQAVTQFNAKYRGPDSGKAPVRMFIHYTDYTPKANHYHRPLQKIREDYRELAGQNRLQDASSQLAAKAQKAAQATGRFSWLNFGTSKPSLLQTMQDTGTTLEIIVPAIAGYAFEEKEPTSTEVSCTLDTFTDVGAGETDSALQPGNQILRQHVPQLYQADGSLHDGISIRLTKGPLLCCYYDRRANPAQPDEPLLVQTRDRIDNARMMELLEGSGAAVETDNDSAISSAAGAALLKVQLPEQHELHLSSLGSQAPTDVLLLSIVQHVLLRRHCASEVATSQQPTIFHLAYCCDNDDLINPLTAIAAIVKESMPHFVILPLRKQPNAYLANDFSRASSAHIRGGMTFQGTECVLPQTAPLLMHYPESTGISRLVGFSPLEEHEDGNVEAVLGLRPELAAKCDVNNYAVDAGQRMQGIEVSKISECAPLWQAITKQFANKSFKDDDVGKKNLTKLLGFLTTMLHTDDWQQALSEVNTSPRSQGGWSLSNLRDRMTGQAAPASRTEMHVIKHKR